jgi:hypothetical protein
VHLVAQDNIARAVSAGTVLRAVAQNDLHNILPIFSLAIFFNILSLIHKSITINASPIIFAQSITARELVRYLTRVEMMTDSDALCTNDHIMLDYNLQIPPKMETLTIVNTGDMISRQVEYEGRVLTVTTLPTTEVNFVLQHIRVVSFIHFSSLFRSLNACLNFEF